jgi:hypothetical protein
MATPALFTTAHSPVSLNRCSTKLPARAIEAASVTSSITGMTSPVEGPKPERSAALASVRTPREHAKAETAEVNGRGPSQPGRRASDEH